MNENNRIYLEFVNHFNKMPVGLPKTVSGFEIQILKQLFTEEEAQIAIKPNFTTR
jgi:hypothetical protein